MVAHEGELPEQRVLATYPRATQRPRVSYELRVGAGVCVPYNATKPRKFTMARLRRQMQQPEGIVR